MTTSADGSRVKWYYCQEDGSGSIHATTPEWTPIRFNSAGLTRETTQIEDDEINDARQAQATRGGTYHINGDLVANLCYGAHDGLIAAAFQSSWVSQITITDTTISAAAADNSFNDSGNGFVSAGFQVGDRVTVSGFTGDVANNLADGIITSVAAGKIIIGGTDGDVIADDAAGESVTIQTAGDYLDVGSTVPTFALLRRNTDTSVDVLYRGCRVGGLNIPATLNQAVTVTFPILGVSVENYTVPGGSTYVTTTTTDRMIPTIGYMKDATSSLGYLADYGVEFTNGMEAVFALFSRSAYDISNGVFKASGNLTAYQEDTVLIDKFINETESDHLVQFLDPAGNAYRIILPKVTYNDLSDPVTGPGKHLHSFGFSAGYDGVTTARIERIAA